MFTRVTEVRGHKDQFVAIGIKNVRQIGQLFYK